MPDGPPSTSRSRGNDAGLDDPEVDQAWIDHVIADDALGDDERGSVLPPAAASRGSWHGAPLGGNVLPQAKRLQVIDSRVCFASCKIHTSHRIRFTGAYLW